MKLDAAIEELEHSMKDPPPQPTIEGMEAIRLGIEAMRRLRHARQVSQFRRLALLPSETEEED